MVEKFITPADLPTDYERELLIILMEECDEISQRAAKILRFGALEVQPGQLFDNVERMCQEIGDFECVRDLLHEQNLIDKKNITYGYQRKRGQLAKYMQTSKPTGGCDGA